MRRWIAYSLFATLLALPQPVRAQSSATSLADFYRGKTVTLIVGYSAGGGYDTYARILARHMGKHLPGNPTIVVQNMPGAGSLRAANHVYNLAGRDPVDIALISASTAVEPLMGNEQAKFDVTKFGWLGSMNQDISFCGVPLARMASDTIGVVDPVTDAPWQSRPALLDGRSRRSGR